MTDNEKIIELLALIAILQNALLTATPRAKETLGASVSKDLAAAFEQTFEKIYANKGNLTP
jgi:hypothetical protein